MADETQTIEEHALSPQCLTNQHEACKHTLSYIPEDGVARTMVCPCRCHGRAPAAGTAEDAPELLYRISWEYEFSEMKLGEEPVKAWIKRAVLTTSRGIAQDWLAAIEELMQTNMVRNLSVLKAPIGKWEAPK